MMMMMMIPLLILASVIAPTAKAESVVDYPKVFSAIVPQPGSYEAAQLHHHFAAQVDFLGIRERVDGDDDWMTIEFIVLSPFELHRLAALMTTDPSCACDLTMEVEKTKELQRYKDHTKNGSSNNRDLKQEFETIPGFSCYKNVAGSFAWMTSLTERAASIENLSVDRIDIGDSYLRSIDSFEGYDIWALNITGTGTGTLSKDKGVVFMISGLHAREFAPTEIVSLWIDELVYGYGIDADITSLLDHTEIHVIQQANPDGRVVAENNQDEYRRKNMNFGNSSAEECGEKNGSQGVDLNRNFPFQWGFGTGSSDDPCAPTYRGPSPASEPEVRAIIDYAKRVFPQEQQENIDNEVAHPEATTKGVFIDIHSFGEVLVWPWGYENKVTPNAKQYEAILSKVQHFTGYAYNGPGPEFLYAASGVTGDFAYGTLGAAAFTLELGTAFYEECENFFDNVLPQNTAALTYGATISRAPFQLSQGPDIGGIRVSPAATGTMVTIEASASDSGYSTAPSAMQNLKSMQLFLDQHPDDLVDGKAPVGWAMTGDFKSSTMGTATYQLDTATLSEGRHMIYVRATDDAGYNGPVKAAWLKEMGGGDEAPVLAPVAQISAPIVAPAVPTVPPVAPVAPTAPPVAPVVIAPTVCVDDANAKFRVAPLQAIVDCEWLAHSNNNSTRDLFCVQGTAPYRVCQKTCNSCNGTFKQRPYMPPIRRHEPTEVAMTTDNDAGGCEDNHAVPFRIFNTNRSCEWLGKNLSRWGRILCKESNTAWNHCPITCGKCQA